MYLIYMLLQIEKYTAHVLEREAGRVDEENALLSPEEFAFTKEWACYSCEHVTVVSMLQLWAC